MKLIKLIFYYTAVRIRYVASSQSSPSGLANNNEFHLKYKDMSVGLIIGIILLVITIICFILDYLSGFCESGNIVTFFLY